MCRMVQCNDSLVDVHAARLHQHSCYSCSSGKHHRTAGNGAGWRGGVVGLLDNFAAVVVGAVHLAGAGVGAEAALTALHWLWDWAEEVTAAAHIQARIVAPVDINVNGGLVDVQVCELNVVHTVAMPGCYQPMVPPIGTVPARSTLCFLADS